MFAKLLIFALLAISFTLAKENSSEVKNIKGDVAQLHKPLDKAVKLLGRDEYIKIENSGLNREDINELKNEVTQFARDLKKKIVEGKKALEVTLTEAYNQGSEKYEEAKQIAKENIDKAEIKIKSKFAEFSKHIDEAIENKKSQ